MCSRKDPSSDRGIRKTRTGEVAKTRTGEVAKTRTGEVAKTRTGEVAKTRIPLNPLRGSLVSWTSNSYLLDGHVGPAGTLGIQEMPLRDAAVRRAGSKHACDAGASLLVWVGCLVARGARGQRYRAVPGVLAMLLAG